MLLYADSHAIMPSAAQGADAARGAEEAEADCTVLGAIEPVYSNSSVSVFTKATSEAAESSSENRDVDDGPSVVRGVKVSLTRRQRARRRSELAKVAKKLKLPLRREQCRSMYDCVLPELLYQPPKLNPIPGRATPEGPSPAEEEKARPASALATEPNRDNEGVVTPTVESNHKDMEVSEASDSGSESSPPHDLLDSSSDEDVPNVMGSSDPSCPVVDYSDDSDDDDDGTHLRRLANSDVRQAFKQSISFIEIGDAQWPSAIAL